MKALPALAALALQVTFLAAATLPAQEPADPYRWLEELNSTRSLEWAKARTSATQAWMIGHAVYDSLRAPVRPVTPNPTPAPPPPLFHGRYVDVSIRPPFAPRGVWGRLLLEQYLNRSARPQILLNIDSLARTEGVPWVFDGAECLAPAHTRCLVRLSHGRSEAVEVREFDTERRVFVDNGFTILESRTQALWVDENTIHVAFATGRNQPNQIRVWRRGTPLDSAEILFAGEPRADEASLLETGGHRLVLHAVGQYDLRYHLIRGSQLVPLAVSSDAKSLRIVSGQVVVLLRGEWASGGRSYPEGSVIAISLERLLRGDREFRVVVPVDATNVVERIETAGDLLLVHMLRNMRSDLNEFQFTAGRWQHRRVPVPEGGTIRIVGTGDDSAIYAFIHETFLEPPTLYVRKASGDIARLGSGGVLFEPAPYLVEQLHATSKDGTRVPYFVVRRRDMPFDGSTPVIMWGYGGNGLSELPRYLGVTGAHWLGRGGAYVLANIRGGGEFGPAWHAAARREKRQNAYHDFQAVAEDLIRRKITSARRLGIFGASNGGLLMGVSMTQRPDLFSAVVGLQPVLDVGRCTAAGGGSMPKAERGDPRDPADWEFIRKWTPYDNLSRTAKYPPMLVQTNRRDDVVHPCHARKFTARMEELGHRILLHESETGGHPGWDTSEALNEAIARRLTFFLVYLHPAYARAAEVTKQ